MKIYYRNAKLSAANKVRLDDINLIVVEYQNQGYKLTLRQLYYQLVSRDIIPNVLAEYAKLSKLLKEGRMAGIVDWSAIEDRLRVPYYKPEFESPKALMDAAIRQYERPRQEGQPVYMEVWVEKDALSGVLRRITDEYHIPILVNRGYSSVSAIHDAYQRFEKDVPTKVLYLGDFDPSGLDMIRDITDRITEFFMGQSGLGESFDFEVIPVALIREQIEKYQPPPNPAKATDPRARGFIDDHGDTSWEVDALRPEVLNEILERAILEYLDPDIYQAQVDQEWEDIKKLKTLKKKL